MLLAAQVVNIAVEVLFFLILIRCVLSFVDHDPRQPLISFIYNVTEPVMAPFRRLVPPYSNIDFSPIIALLVVQIVGQLLVEALVRL